MNRLRTTCVLALSVACAKDLKDSKWTDAAAECARAHDGCREYT
jgi:hypothetical protein